MCASGAWAIAIVLLASCGPDVSGDPDADDLPDAAAPGDDGGGDGGDGGAELSLVWVQRVGTEWGLTPTPRSVSVAAASDDLLVVGIGTAYPVTVFADDPDPVSPATASNTVLAWVDGDGARLAARTVAEHWAAQPGFGAGTRCTAMHADGTTWSGGWFGGAATFGAGDPGAVQYQTMRVEDSSSINVAVDPYVARFGADHALAWATRGTSADATSWSECFALVAHDDGTVTALIDHRTPLTVAGQVYAPSLLLVRLAPNGTVAWATRLVGVGSYDLAALPDGGVALGGTMTGEARLADGEPDQLVVPNADGVTRGLVAVFGADGTPRWARPIACDALLTLGAVAALGDDVVATATCADGLDYLSIVTRYRGDGEPRWTRTFEDAGPAIGYGLATTSDGSIWMTGGVGEDGGTIGDHVIPPEPGRGVALLVGLDGDGEVLAVHEAAKVPSGSDLILMDLLALPSGDLVLAGMYRDGAVLEPGTAAERVLAAPGSGGPQWGLVARYRLGPAAPDPR